MKMILVTAISMLAFCATAAAAKKTVGVVHVYGNTMTEVEKKVVVEIKKMKKGDYYSKMTGRKCDEAKPYNVSFKEAGESYGIGADGSLVPARPMAAIKFTCITFTKD